MHQFDFFFFEGSEQLNTKNIGWAKMFPISRQQIHPTDCKTVSVSTASPQIYIFLHPLISYSFISQ